MPIFVDTDHGPKNKLYDGSAAGASATAAEGMMQKVVRRKLGKAPGFTTTAKGKGYIVMLKISKLEPDGPDTNCRLTGSITRYPKTATKSGAKGDEILSTGWTGGAKASGHSEGSMLDCVEAVTESMMDKGIPVMTSDFLKR